jgi:hypothetical protein
MSTETIVGTVTLSYELSYFGPNPPPAITPVKETTNLEFFSNTYAPGGIPYYYLGVLTGFNDLNFPSIKSSYPNEPDIPGISLSIPLTLAENSTTNYTVQSCYLQFSNAYPFTLSNVNVTVVINNTVTVPFNDNVSITIDAGTYTYTFSSLPNSGTSGMTNGYQNLQTTTEMVYDQFFYAESPTTSAVTQLEDNSTMMMSQVFSPDATRQATSTKKQTAGVLSVLDPNDILLNTKQKQQIANESGLIAGHTVSIVEKIDNIFKIVNKK